MRLVLGMWLIVFLLLALAGCGRAQLDTITGLACPVNLETQTNLVNVYGAEQAQEIIQRFCP